MARLWELPGFDEGAKVRISTWDKTEYVYRYGGDWKGEDEEYYTDMDFYFLDDNWELFQEPFKVKEDCKQFDSVSYTGDHRDSTPFCLVKEKLDKIKVVACNCHNCEDYERVAKFNEKRLEPAKVKETCKHDNILTIHNQGSPEIYLKLQICKDCDAFISLDLNRKGNE